MPPSHPSPAWYVAPACPAALPRQPLPPRPVLTMCRAPQLISMATWRVSCRQNSLTLSRRQNNRKRRAERTAARANWVAATGSRQGAHGQRGRAGRTTRLSVFASFAQFDSSWVGGQFLGRGRRFFAPEGPIRAFCSRTERPSGRPVGAGWGA
jgi:hypothetical protein